MLINQKLLLSDCRFFDNQAAINPYYQPGEKINRLKAQKEHQLLETLFKKAGCQIFKTSPASSQDGVYTANWALVRGKKAVLSRLPPTRKSEELVAKKVLQGLGKTVYQLPANWRFSGQGDSLIAGDYLFAGSHYRSDPWAQEEVAKILNLKLILLQTQPQKDKRGKVLINPVSSWPDSFFYDLDLALSIIRPPTKQKKGLIAYCPQAFLPASQQVLASLSAFEKISVSLTEAKTGFACNLVSTGQDVIMSAQAPKLQQALQERGLLVHTPKIEELAKGGGYIRCISLTLD